MVFSKTRQKFGTPFTVPGGGTLTDPKANSSAAFRFLSAALNRDTNHPGSSSSNSSGSPSVRVQQINSPNQPIGVSKITLAPETGASAVTIFGNLGLSAGNIAKQQAISDKYGIATFDVKGDISTIPTNQPIQNVEGSGKFAPADFGAVIDTINAALFPNVKDPNQPQPPQKPQDSGSSGNTSLFDSLKAGLTDLGNQINGFIGNLKLPDASGTQGNLPADQSQQQAQNGGGLLGGAPSSDVLTGSQNANTSTQPTTSFFDQLKKNPTELILIAVAIILFVAMIARHR